MSEHLIFTDNGIIHQNFDIPSPLISYICENPIPSSEFLYKIYSTCKYFYLKMKIVPCSYMTILNSMHSDAMMSLVSPLPKIFDNGNRRDYETIFPKSKIYSSNFKLCCSSRTFFHVYLREGEDPKFISHLLTKLIWYCRNSSFVISEQILTSNEYKILAEAATLNLSMSDVIVTNPDGKIVSVEELLEIGINIKHFGFSSKKNHDFYYTNETAQKISKLFRPQKFVHFRLEDLPASFNPPAFLTFIKNNSEIQYSDITLKFNKNVPRKTIYAFFRYLKTELDKDKKYDNLKFNGTTLIDIIVFI